MKHPSPPQSATSLPHAPRDESSARMLKYVIMMGVRVACFVAMILVTPYGWYTWLFAAGAVFLPYIAVVIANVGQESRAAPAETVTLPALDPKAERPAPTPHSQVITISETPPSTHDA
ncbi:DUF3099 domain-containing protein [Microbacterium sp. Clip185]|uniref:DUF3099 domain-containing protein n=1 Tax=Microbacterium sp. Clip185 TaxID=3025663 RepID=UPI0023655CD6|nr:DUF3099 domain-containing protein [Microbacterium sp. Clip185]WDG16599.1 DUF3099 domain-containing protein [Microbacterium sp. Clip185]